MALHDPRPDFDEERGWQSDMEDEQMKGPRGLAAGALGWVFLALGVTLITAVLAAPMIADAAYARPAICNEYAPAECVAASEDQ